MAAGIGYQSGQRPPASSARLLARRISKPAALTCTRLSWNECAWYKEAAVQPWPDNPTRPPALRLCSGSASLN
jgi:hypothetical protein